MGTCFGRLIGERRVAPSEDLISGLIAAQVEGKHLSPQELPGFCVLLLVAGERDDHQPARQHHPVLGGRAGAQEPVRADQSLLPTTIEN